MSDGITATTKGIADFREALTSIPTKLRRRALLNSLRKAGRVVQGAARAAAPVLTLAGALKAPYRKPGTVQKAIAVRTSRVATKAGDVGVFVNVKPLPGNRYRTVRTGLFGKRRVLVKASKRSAQNPNDPFYWRFVNFDHRSRSGSLVPGFHFLEKGAARLDEALVVFEKDLGPQIQKLDTNPKDPL